MNKFYTKSGDDGYTNLLGEGRFPKEDKQLEVLGVIDEANAALGLARVLSLSPLTSIVLIDVQKDLYSLMAEVASLPENVSNFRKINADRVTWLELQIDEISKKVIIPNEFIIPGDSKGGAAIDLARTIVRRGERGIASLIHLKKLENHDLLRYMNRLSSLCFVLELLENQVAGINHPTLVK